MNRSRKIVAVIGIRREDVKSGVAHARTAPEVLPIWAWCAENSEPVAGCERYHSGANAWQLLNEVRHAWPALSIVSWTGTHKAPVLKLLPLLIPPFRVVAFNEAGGFFAVKPDSLLNHGGRRLRDSLIAAARRLADGVGGLGQWLHSLSFRTGEMVRDVSDLGWNFFLALLAVTARPTGPLARAAMQKARGKPAPVAMPVTEGSTFIEITLANRDWPRRRILRTLERSEATFVIFRRPGDAYPAEPLITLAREHNCFAAARQTAWSGWRKAVLHKHPFRVLQAGEATRVEAPFSTLIAMRRDMLLRFGVPRALTSGAALMLLYWKAAAAGLECLTVGYGSEVTQEPAMELEDLEFALRKPADLAPTRRERSRGNVAFSRHPFRAKPRVLIVSPYLPFPLSHGGAVRIYNLCRVLADTVDFVLACFHEKGDVVHYSELDKIFREVYVVDIDEKHADSTVPSQIAGYRNSAMAALIEDLCWGGIDVLQLEYTQMAEYRSYAGSVPVILVEHDVTFTLHLQLGNSLQAGLWLDFEQKALRGVNAVWTMSGRDRELAIENGANAGSTAVVENGVDLDRFRPQMKTVGGPRILFVGSFRHLPNLLAFKALRGTVMPALWKTFPAVILHVIAGPKPPALGKLDPRISVEGFVEDVRPAYRECDVAVVPLAVSAGTNIKVMEAMACGRAVVSTPLGCQGLGLTEGSDLLIREIGSEFASAIALLLADDVLRARMGQRARETAELRFDWQAISRHALATYASLRGNAGTINSAPSSAAPCTPMRASKATE